MSVLLCKYYSNMLATSAHCNQAQRQKHRFKSSFFTAYMCIIIVTIAVIVRIIVNIGTAVVIIIIDVVAHCSLLVDTLNFNWITPKQRNFPHIYLSFWVFDIFALQVYFPKLNSILVCVPATSTPIHFDLHKT